MRVLHVIPSLGPLRGGPSVVARSMAGDLARAGLEVHVVASDDNGPSRMEVPLGRAIHQGGVTYRYFPRQTRFYTVSLPLAAWLTRHVNDYDLVHIHALFSFASLAAASAARRRGVPYILRPLGTLGSYGMQRRRPWLKRLSFQLFERRALAGAAAVHYTSAAEQREAATLGVPHRAAVIPLAVAPPAPAPSEALRARYPQLAGRTVALFLARVDPKKGLDLLLPALAQARARHSTLTLIVAGTGDPPYLDALRRQANDLGLADAVLWTGFLEGAAKDIALAGADFFVLPSYAENFGVAVVEALAAGLPALISTQVGIHHDITAAGAGLVVPCDTTALAAALAALAADPAGRRDMGVRARRLAAERYIPEAVTGQLISLYKRTVTHSAPTAAL